jgi:hypothetical protein
MGILDALRVRLWVPQLADSRRSLQRDLLVSAMLDKNGLPSPLNGYSLPLWNSTNINLNSSQGKHVSRGRQGSDSIYDGQARSRGIQEASTTLRTNETRGGGDDEKGKDRESV